MPQLKQYNLFISHSWTYSDAYEKLTTLLDKQNNFFWYDYSIPKDDPVHNAKNDKQLEDAIREKIRHTHCVVILAGVYSTYSKWINKEIAIAKELNKPIIAVEPWLSEKTSQVVKENATAIVKWNSESVVSAIREKSI